MRGMLHLVARVPLQKTLLLTRRRYHVEDIIKSQQSSRKIASSGDVASRINAIHLNNHKNKGKGKATSSTSQGPKRQPSYLTPSRQLINKKTVGR